MITDEQVYDLCATWDDGSMSDHDSDDSSIVAWESKVFRLCRESLWFCKCRIDCFGLFNSS